MSESLDGKVVKPKLHERFQELVDRVFPDDDGESGFAEACEAGTDLGTISGRNLIIEYEDSKGQLTQRVISCRQMTNQGGTAYLKAFCHHRSAIRTFRLDRILDLFDPITGETLSPVQAFFAQFATDLETASGLTWGLSVGRKADLIALINALVFLARCDKEYHPKEREALERAITAFWLRLELDGDPDCEAILSHADRLSPDSELFWTAVQRISEDERLEQIFRRSMQELIVADGVIKPEEHHYSIEIESYLTDCR